MVILETLHQTRSQHTDYHPMCHGTHCHGSSRRQETSWCLLIRTHQVTTNFGENAMAGGDIHLENTWLLSPPSLGDVLQMRLKHKHLEIVQCIPTSGLLQLITLGWLKTPTSVDQNVSSLVPSRVCIPQFLPPIRCALQTATLTTVFFSKSAVVSARENQMKPQVVIRAYL